MRLEPETLVFAPFLELLSSPISLSLIGCGLMAAQYYNNPVTHLMINYLAHTQEYTQYTKLPPHSRNPCPNWPTSVHTGPPVTPCDHWRPEASPPLPSPLPPPGIGGS